MGLMPVLSDAVRLWLATHRKERLNRDQKVRLREIIHYARTHSAFYADYYNGITSTSTSTKLPPVTKTLLYENFDRWVTDPTIKRKDVEAFIKDKSNIGKSFSNKYIVWSSSGTSGKPGLILHDKTSIRVNSLKGYISTIS